MKEKFRQEVEEKKYTKAERKGPKKSTEVPKDWIEYQKAMDKTILERDESGA